MSTLERAITLAAEAHTGVRDKGGSAYILHPLRVMLRVQGEHAMMAAVLHDVVEDSPVTLAQLREVGFPEPVVSSVDALTKRKGIEEDYFAFVERAGTDDVARTVKLADIEDNMDRSRIPTPTEGDEVRLVRYRRARKLVHTIEREHGETDLRAPTILPLRSTITRDEVIAECPGARPIYACDFYIEGAERGQEVPGGLQLGRILNVDHHAPVSRMESQLTSTRLAYEHLRGSVSSGRAAWVVINHTDCDSILSSAMLMGYLKPEVGLVDSSLCADHTGEEDPVADLLQSLDEGRRGDRTEEQYLESLRNLHLLLAAKPLEPVAVQALQRHRGRRLDSIRLVEAGIVRNSGGVASGQLEEEIDGAFFPALISDAVVIMLASPHRDHPERWTMKLRLGRGAPPGVTLHSLRLQDWDPAYGGRWNAGSNKRGGGSAMIPAEYANRLRQRLQEHLL